MDFAPSQRVEELSGRIAAFLDEHLYPVELEALKALDEEVGPGVPYPRILVELRERAKADGLWNLFLPGEEYGGGLTNWEYGMLCEEMGRSIVSPMVFNCSAPDTGNAEIILEHGTPEQKDQWLNALLEGDIRSCFSMTEPETSGSDPTGLKGRAELDGDEWVINAHKWFTSGAVGAAVAIAMVVTDPDAAPHKRASMILVPTDAPGFNLIRPVSVMGHDGGPGHCEIRYEDCRVPKDNLLGERGTGFKVAQDRLGPGRIHHCMRLIGMAERALELMTERVQGRVTFGRPVAEQSVVQHWIAQSRIRIEQARLLVLKTAWLIDTVGNQGARTEIAAIKVAVPAMTKYVVDRAIQAHGGMGVSQLTPLPLLYAHTRTLQIADGPDEVHEMVIARRELRAR
jgi:acyl-CoA dehydrogenase